jgi:hypothetical protein
MAVRARSIPLLCHHPSPPPYPPLFAGNAVSALLLLRTLQTDFVDTAGAYGDAMLSLLVGCAVAVFASLFPWGDRAVVHSSVLLQSFCKAPRARPRPPPRLQPCGRLVACCML